MDKTKRGLPIAPLLLLLVGCAQGLPLDTEANIALRFLNALSDKDYDAATEDIESKLTGSPSAAELQSFWEKMLAEHGRYVETKRLDVSGSVGDVVSVRLECEFEDSRTTLVVVVQNGSITHYFEIPSFEIPSKK